MKVLRIILFTLLAIIALPFIVAVFAPSEYEVEREVVINQPKDQVFNYLKYLKNQDNFSKWANIDPNMVKTYEGTDGEVGFVSAWQSDHEDVGSGEQEITAITEGERIDYELRFLEPFESISPAYIITEEDEGHTRVKWGFYGKINYPLNLMLLFMDMEETIGNDLEEGLKNLKNQLEQ